MKQRRLCREFLSFAHSAELRDAFTASAIACAISGGTALRIGGKAGRWFFRETRVDQPRRAADAASMATS